MANHVFTNQTITNTDPAELHRLFILLNGWNQSEEESAGFVSYLLDQEVTEQELDRNTTTDAIGAKWMSIEEVEKVSDTEIILMTTTAWSHPCEMWENLEQRGFEIDANYEDEMPNFFGTYSTEDGDDYVDTEDMYEAIDTALEDFESDLKETSDYNNAMYEECVDAAIKAIENPVSEFNKETLGRLVENYLEVQDHYVGE